jgi:hypothetical protein
MKKTQWPLRRPHSDKHCVGVLVPAMTVAYRTNSIKIPKTTIYVYIYVYRYIHKHTIKYNNYDTQRTVKTRKGKAVHV